MEHLGSSNLESSKEKIMQFIQTRGPSIPISLSNHLGIDTLLTSAFLSGLLSDKELKISVLRVGNSPVYYIHGQELQLTKFSGYLGGKEKEAYFLLKEKKVLNDSEMLPAIRVALRAIKDFAFPFQHDGKLFWRFIEISEEDARKNTILVEKFAEAPKIPKESTETIGEVEKPAGIIVEKPMENIFEKSAEKIVEKPAEKIEIIKQEIVKKISSIGGKKQKPRVNSGFFEGVMNFLESNNLKIAKEIIMRKKEFLGIVSTVKEGNVSSYLCVARDKKSISEKDIIKVLQEGQKEKLPVLLVSNGEANKKAAEWLDYLGEVVGYRKI